MLLSAAILSPRPRRPSNSRIASQFLLSSPASFCSVPVSDSSGCAASSGAGLRIADPLIVMADSYIIGNVEKPLVRSVVELSTTDVDASTPTPQTTASDETPNICETLAQQPGDASTNIEPSSPEARHGGGPEPVDDGLVGIVRLNGINSSFAGDGLKRTDLELVGAPGSRPGSVSPTKTDGSRLLDRKASVKNKSFRALDYNRPFLKEQAHVSRPTSSSLSSALPNSKVSAAFPQQPTRSTTVSKLKLVKTGGASQSSRSGGPGSSLSITSKRNDQAHPVWNKNQPIPPAPTKDVTDEELKKEFGIHMASRLGPEGTGAKWADIDDDDDDWVPEVLGEWSDALKPPQSGDESEFTAQPPPRVEPTLGQIEGSSPPRAPVLFTTREEARPKTLVTERLSSKPIEKPAPPTIRPSPWATVPPPPAAPMAIGLPQPRGMEPPRRSEMWTNSSAPPSSGPAMAVKEVSADVYGHSWRDTNHNHNQGPRERELYNSVTDQLEPVHENWGKGPRPRPEVTINKPLVLQRPTGPPPAEPSPAFQQQRGGVMHHRPDDHRRKRASSNVSGGSGSTGRRPSFTRFGAEQLPTPDDGRFLPRSGPLSHTPTDVYQDPNPNPIIVPPRTEAPTSAADGEESRVLAPAIVPPISQVDYEDPVAKQERIMKTSRELARKRRQEEEAIEEAARKERLRAKMAELEKAQKEKEESEAAQRKAAEEREAERKAAEERTMAAEREIAEKKATEEKATKERAVIEQMAAEEAKRVTEATHLAEHSRVGDHTTRDPSASFVRGQSPGRPISIPTAPQGRRSLGPMQNRSPHKGFAVPAGLKDQPWKNAATGGDRYTTWGSAPNNNQGSGGNPWGPIEKPRFSGLNGVGNGTFDNRFSGFATRPPPLQNRDDRRPSRGPPAPPSLPRGGISQEDRAQAVSRWNLLPDKIQEEEAEHRRKSRMDYLARQAEEATSGVKRAPQVQPKLAETWRKVELRDDQGEVNRRLIAVKKTQREEEEASSAKLVAISEPLVAPSDTRMEGGLVEPQSQDHRMTQVHNIPTGPAASRSRFFPITASNLIAQHLGSEPKAWDEPTPRRPSPPRSPPPPMSAEHPVHGDINSRIVQLPPSSSQAPGRVSPALHPNSYPKTEQPKSPRVASTTEAFEAVQQRILVMTQKHSPPQQIAQPQPQPLKAVALRDFSSTKPLYEVSPERNISRAVTVSLPGQIDEEDKAIDELDVNGMSVLSKPDDEEFLHELFPRDFGSTPTVKIPHPPPQIYQDDLIRSRPVAPKGFKRPYVRWQLQTADIFSAFCSRDFTNGEGKRFIPVHLPGCALVEVPCREVRRNNNLRKTYPQPRNRNNFGRHNNANPRYMGRPSDGVGRRVAEPVQ